MTNKAAIKHIEFWVSDLKKSISFYKSVFDVVGWNKVGKNAFSNGATKIYFIEQTVKSQKTLGPRHICFLASSRKVVDKVSDFLIRNKSEVIRGPLAMQYKGKKSYTVDFKDPDGYIIEVATKSIFI